MSQLSLLSRLPSVEVCQSDVCARATSDAGKTSTKTGIVYVMPAAKERSGIVQDVQQNGILRAVVRYPVHHQTACRADAQHDESFAIFLQYYLPSDVSLHKCDLRALHPNCAACLSEPALETSMWWHGNRRSADSPWQKHYLELCGHDKSTQSRRPSHLAAV